MRSLRYVAGRLRREKHPVRAVIGRVLIRTPLCSLLTIPCGSYRLRFHPTSLSMAYWIDAGSRHGDEAFLAAYLRPGDTVVDVGANIGALALAAAAVVRETGRVLAVEPHPRTFRFMERNIAMNPFRHIEARNAAVGAAAASVSFSNARLDDQNRVVEDGGIRVPVETLDDLCAGCGPIALLKVDTEGYELPVFQGARNVLDRVETVYFEAWETHYRRYGYTTADVLSLLAAHGFHLFRFGAEDRLEPVPPDYRAESCINLLAIRSVEAFAGRTGRRGDHLSPPGEGRCPTNRPPGPV